MANRQSDSLPPKISRLLSESLLGEAKRRRFVSEVRPIIDELLAVGYWLHPERVIRPFLEAMGEAQPL